MYLVKLLSTERYRKTLTTDINIPSRYFKYIFNMFNIIISGTSDYEETMRTNDEVIFCIAFFI